MKTLANDTIIEKVRLILNEAQDNEAEFVSDADDTELDKLITGKSSDALDFVLRHADVGLLESDCIIKTADYLLPSACGEILAKVSLPKFCRLVKASSSCWQKSFTEAKDDTHEDYAKQNDKYAMATSERPDVFIKRDEGDYTMEMYCIKDGSSIKVEYIKEPHTECTAGVQISESSETGFLYYIAYLVALTLESSLAESLLGTALPLLGIKTGGES